MMREQLFALQQGSLRFRLLSVLGGLASILLLTGCSSEDRLGYAPEDGTGGGAGDTGGETGGSAGLVGNDTGGASGMTGSGGVLGPGGQSSGPPVDPPGSALTLNPSRASRVDLLLMIDNSISMADKQQLLATAVPPLLNRLVDPPCVDRSSGAVIASTSQGGCPDGSEPEFTPVADIHVGVITSSLGGHGGTLCTPAHGEQYWNETQNDRGRLISRPGPSRDVPTTWDNMGFLSWDPDGTARNAAAIPGEADPSVLLDQFQNLVLGAGEQGCGYEASLEAWYRFLVDPDPPMDVVYDANTRQSVGVGLDDVLLSQRAQFLRPDSLLVIGMLTDEDDCSVIDHGYGFLHTNTDEGAMPRSTSICETNPNDPCCLSCIQANWPSECNDPQSDVNCRAGLFHGDVDSSQDRLNLRCFQQKRRFGIDLLYPTSRYVNALISKQLVTRDGAMAPNPLFARNEQFYPDLNPRQDSSRIYVAGIVGVPWQDIATDESLTDPSMLQYLTAADIAQRGIWEDILGDPSASPPVPPNDPFVVQSIEPRIGTNPRTEIPITPPVPGPGGNAINGHEYQIPANSDLQYACIFPLAEPRDCADAAPGQGCDCKVSNEIFDRPLCNDTVQEYAKAYPAPRILQVLKDYGENAIVGSICPKTPNCADPSDPSCGLNPVMGAVADQVAEGLKARNCLGQELPTDESGMLACRVIEVTRQPSPAPCGADLPGRDPLSEETRSLAVQHLTALGLCDEESTPCNLFSLCEIEPAADNVNAPAYQECLNFAGANIQTATGYCYIDAMTDWNQNGVVNCTRECYAIGAEDCDCIGNPEFVSGCDVSRRRLLRFVSLPANEQPLPWPNSTILVLCPEGVEIGD